MQARLTQHLLAPQTWIPQAKGNIHVARYYQNQVEPVKTFCTKDYTDTLEGRLMLLNDAEWKILGFALVLAPLSGQIGNTIDGKLRKAVKGRFESDVIQKLDNLPSAYLRGLLSHRLAHGWSDTESVIVQGINALKAWGKFTPSQRQILEMRFPEAAPAVTQLNHELVEELCKISLPALSWLWNSQESVSEQA
jgi:hypothetical protein